MKQGRALKIHLFLKLLFIGKLDMIIDLDYTI